MSKPSLALFKIGGKVIDRAELLEDFLRGFAAHPGAKILVHGGGVIAEELAQKLGIVSEMHEGRRKTSRAMRDLVTMVYGGGINKSLVASLQSLGCDAIGLSGADAGLIRSRRRSPLPIDYGYVGDITEVNAGRLDAFLKLGLTPVLAPLSFATEILNTNADSIAGAVASALADRYSVKAYYAFEAPGVMLDLSDRESLIPELPRSRYRELLEARVFTDGMLPKLKSAFACIDQGVEAIVLADAANCLQAAQGVPFRGTRLSP